MNPDDDQDQEQEPDAAEEAPWLPGEEQGQAETLTDEERGERRADYEAYLRLEFPGLIGNE